MRRSLIVFTARIVGPAEAGLSNSEIADRIVDVSMRYPLRGRRPSAEFGRGKPRVGLECAVERRKRLESGIQRDRQHGHVDLAGIGECRLRLSDAIAIEEGVEVAVTQPVVDEASQPVFRY